MYLERNYLTGDIPHALMALRGLQYLDLSQNNFSEKIPQFLGELSLVYLNLSYNGFEDEVPTVGIFQNGSAISLEGNSGLCGGIPHLNFPPCPSTHPKQLSILFKILVPLICAGAICASISA